MDNQNPPQNPAERRAWIKYRLELAGYNFAKLSREHGLYRTAAKIALDKPYPRMERAIAEKIGVPPEVIWPERYQPVKQNSKRRRHKQ